jgi:hypothetical protein
MLDVLATHRKHLAWHAIEVKGRAGVGDIEPTQNEWSRACNLRDKYWLYAVYDRGTGSPRPPRVQAAFPKLTATAKGGVIIDEEDVFRASGGNI